MAAVSENLANARTFLTRVLPWPSEGREGAWINIHYTTTRNPDTGKSAWPGYAVKSVDEAVERIRSVMANSKASGDVYVCMSSQRRSRTVKLANGFTFKAAERSQNDAVELRALFLDIDVKPGAYETTQDAALALTKFCKKTGLPHPTLAVRSGSGGLHVYWCFNEALTPARWQPLANALAEAARRKGLICDTACTVDSARILRVPDTFNCKHNGRKPVTLAGPWPSQDYSVELIAGVLEPWAEKDHPVATGASVVDFKTAPLADFKSFHGVELGSARDRCGFLHEAFTTGGAGFLEPLWHLSVLASVFDKDGLATAHVLSQGHERYNSEETAALYQRKCLDRDLKGVGWPSCQAIENAGSSHCAACPSRLTVKSPLHLAVSPTRQMEANQAAAPLRVVGIGELAVMPPPRRWMHGADLLRGNCTLIVSPGGKGKTATLIGTALACASGKPLLGAKVFGGSHRVLYINTEDGTEEIARRIRAAQRHHGLSDADLDGLRVGGVDMARVTLLTSERGTHRIHEDGWKRLRFLIEEHRPDLIILDPLANLSAHTLNDNAAATALMAALTGLAVEFDAAVLIAHHTGKGRDLTSQEAAMGASALVNSARVVLSMDTLGSGDAGKLGVLPSEASRFFRLISVKGNLARPSADDRWFELKSVALNNGTAEYPSGDHVQVVAPFTPSLGGAIFPPHQIVAALSAIATASPPLSPKKQATKRYAAPVIAQAIGSPGPKGEFDAVALLSSLIVQGLVREEEVKISRNGGRGPQSGTGIVLTDLGKSRLGASDTNKPQSPKSAHSPTLANQGGAMGLALQGDASVAWGGTGGTEAGVPAEAESTDRI